MNDFTMPPAPPLKCSAAQTNNLEQCYDDYLVKAWSEFNKSLSDFQKTCGKEGNPCDYSKMVPAYQKLMSCIDTVLSAMNTAIQKNVPTPMIQKGFADISAMRDNLNRKMRELNDETTANRGFMPDYKMNYDRVFYMRLVLVLAMTFFLVAIIYIMFF
jgi:hypothetical protein